MKNRLLDFASRFFGRRSAVPETEKQATSTHTVEDAGHGANKEIRKQESAHASGKNEESKPFVGISVQQRIDEKRKAKGLPPIVRQLPDITSELGEGDILLHQSLTRHVVLRPDNTVVKYGKPLNLVEVDVLHFLAEAGIPVPRVIRSGKKSDGKEYDYIEMSYVEGTTLEEVWDEMSQDQRLDIAHQLRDLLRVMRTLPPPPGFIGAFNREILIDTRGFDTFIRPACKNEEEFNLYLTNDEEIPTPIQEGFRHGIGTDHRIVFTHCDIAPRNIMVRDNRIVGFLDWEVAGWYPAYWDYVKFFHTKGGRRRDWNRLIDEIFPESYPHELLQYTGLLWYQRRFDSNPMPLNKNIAPSPERNRDRQEQTIEKIAV